MSLKNTSVIQQQNTKSSLKNTAQARSTDLPSKALKNTSKGRLLERKLSLELHQVGLPVLVSPELLRSRNLGQIDIARFVKQNSEIEVYEIKSSSLGEFAMKAQRRRISEAAAFLTAIFGKAVKLIVKVG